MPVVVGAAGLMFTGLLIWSAYRNGMFFDASFYRWEWMLMASTVLSLCITTRMQRRMTRGSSSGICEYFMVKKNKGPGEEPVRASVPLAAYTPLLIALLFGLSLINKPASVHGTLEQLLRWSAYGAFLISGYLWLRIGPFRSWLFMALQGSGLFLIGGALAGWLGWIDVPEMILSTGDSSLSAVGARLAGFVQYPNFLGAVSGAYLLWNWLLMIRAGSYRTFLLAVMMAAPLMLVLLLTESRAAWLTTAVGWLAGLLLLTREQRVKWLVYSGWTLVGAGAAYRIVFAAGLQGSHEGVGHMGETLGLLAILMASAAGFTALRTVFAGLSRRQLEIAAWAGLGAACLIMALLLPAVIQGRISSGHFQTAGARTMFYKDAWSLFLEAPLLGQGGDTWRMLFTQIQTYPYIGNEVHSGYLDLLLDLGIVGLLVFAFMMYGLLRIVWRHDRAGILPVGLLMVHAAVDFDMSFGYYWLLLFSWLVYYSPYPGAAQRGQSLFASPRSGQLPPRSVSLGKRAAAKRQAGFQFTAALLTAAVFAFASAYSWQFDKAVAYREAAASAAGNEQTALLERALAANPYWSRIRVELSQLVPPLTGARQLEAGLRYEPQSVPLLSALGLCHARLGNVKQAAAYLRLALQYDHYDRDNQTGAIMTMARLARDKQAGGQLDDSRLAAATALAFFEAFESQGAAARRGGRDFEVTAESRKAAEDTRLLLSELARARTAAQTKMSSPQTEKINA